MQERPASSMLLDELDQQIVAALRENARTTNKAMATEFKVAESTIGARIRSMSERNIMRVVAMHDIRAMGYDLFAHGAIETEGRDPTEVAADLSLLPEVATLNLFSGAPQIMINIVAADRAALRETLADKIGKVAGIRRVETTIAIRIVKFDTFYTSFSGPGFDHSEDESADITSRILRVIERDARLSNREIARLLNVSEANVRRRMRSLTETGAMKMGAMINPQALGLTCSAFLLLKVRPAHIEQVAAELSESNELSFVSITAGAYEVMGVVTTTDQRSLFHIANRVQSFEGVLSIEVKEPAEVVKMTYNLIRILPGQGDTAEA